MLSTYMDVRQTMQTADLVRASSLITWNRYCLTVLGIWPLRVINPLFAFHSTYMTLHCTMGVAHLIKYFSQPKLVITNLADNIFLLMLLGKLIICRLNCNIMAKFLKAIENDFLAETYSCIEERMAFLYYNHLGHLFTKLSVGVSSIAAILYYCKIFIDNWSKLKAGNFSCEILPYPVYPFHDIKDLHTYICMCLYLLIAVPIIVLGYAGTDGFIVTMVLHICGQFSALACKIDYLLKDRENYHRHMTNIIVRHHKLIKLTNIMEDKFNFIYLQQTLGSIFLLCLTLFNSLVNTESGTNIVSSVLYAYYVTCVFNLILGYCYIGECLITESVKLRDAFYNIQWYNNLPSQTKLISICITRTEKPMTLTAKKFYILSLETLTNIVKTAMAYLSILRNFI